MTAGIESDQRNYVRCYKQRGKHVGNMRDQRENQVSVIFCFLPNKIDAPTCSDVEGSNGCWLPHSWLQNVFKNVLKRKMCWLEHSMWFWALFKLLTLSTAELQIYAEKRFLGLFGSKTLPADCVQRGTWVRPSEVLGQGTNLPCRPSPRAVMGGSVLRFQNAHWCTSCLYIRGRMGRRISKGQTSVKREAGPTPCASSFWVLN